MVMYAIVKSENELYHFGKKGMKWGVRHERKNYDYHNSDAYRKGNGRTRTIMTNQYTHNRRFFGKKAANKIEYDVQNGMDRKKATKRQLPKALIKKTAITAAVMIGIMSAPKVAKWYKTNRDLLKLNNAVVDAETAMLGLNEVKGGFTSGYSQVKRGKQIYDAISGLR